jgi:hypothetical protein
VDGEALIRAVVNHILLLLSKVFVRSKVLVPAASVVEIAKEFGWQLELRLVPISFQIRVCLAVIRGRMYIEG